MDGLGIGGFGGPFGQNLAADAETLDTPGQAIDALKISGRHGPTQVHHVAADVALDVLDRHDPSGVGHWTFSPPPAARPPWRHFQA